MTNPIKPMQLVSTPDSMEELQDYLERFSGAELVLAQTCAMMAWNLASKVVDEAEEKYKIRVKFAYGIIPLQFQSILEDSFPEIRGKYEHVRALGVKSTVSHTYANPSISDLLTLSKYFNVSFSGGDTVVID